MYETQFEVNQLQELLDHSIGQAGEFLRSSLQMPKCSLSARQLVRYFTGIQTAAVATVTAKGEPRVAPTGVILFHGQFAIPTVANSARMRHIRQRPAVSFSHYVGEDLAIILHGRALVLLDGDQRFVELEAHQRALSGSSVRDWGEGVYLQLEPNVIYTFARRPEEYAE